MRKNLWSAAGAVLLGVALWGLAQGQGEARQATPRAVVPRGDLAPDEKSTIDIFRRSNPSVVYITTLDKVVNLWTMNVTAAPRGTGSGFVWDELGHVVTNYHVVAGATAAKVRLGDQRSFDARLVGVSPEHDLAVLQIQVPERRPQPLPLGSSHDLLVGQRVLAIGNPFGLDHTLTTGVISALDRSLEGEDGATIHHLIQTDAAINPGNSGGPLLDSAGHLIGVNTAIYSPSGASAGIGFAVPADTVNRVVPELIAHGRFRRPTLGVSANERLNVLATRQLGVQGVLVLEVERGSPAARAGLRGSRLARDGSLVPGDVIQSIDGQAVDSPAAMDKLLDGHKSGDRVRLRIWREGQVLTLETTVSVRD
ncbi:2-alkenal reductase [Denitratisoma sp. DHT3]|nr:2-alkenal reductase [Denitratisoma sp. DHT3]